MDDDIPITFSPVPIGEGVLTEYAKSSDELRDFILRTFQVPREYLGLLPLTTEDAILAHLLTNPADDGARLILADWLDDHGHAARAFDHRKWAALHAVLKAPDDDAPRLAYVAVCDNYGDKERAEFIRCQFELATMEDRCQDNGKCETTGRVECRWHALRRRERELLPLTENYAGLGVDAFHSFANSTAVVEWVDTGTVELCFRRGFVERVTCACADALLHLDEVRRATPLKKCALTSFTRQDCAAIRMMVLRRIQSGQSAPVVSEQENIERAYLEYLFPGIEFEQVAVFGPSPLAGTARHVAEIEAIDHVRHQMMLDLTIPRVEDDG